MSKNYYVLDTSYLASAGDLWASAYYESIKNDPNAEVIVPKEIYKEVENHKKKQSTRGDGFLPLIEQDKDISSFLEGLNYTVVEPEKNDIRENRSLKSLEEVLGYVDTRILSIASSYLKYSEEDNSTVGIVSADMKLHGAASDEISRAIYEYSPRILPPNPFEENEFFLITEQPINEFLTIRPKHASRENLYFRMLPNVSAQGYNFHIIDKFFKDRKKVPFNEPGSAFYNIPATVYRDEKLPSEQLKLLSNRKLFPHFFNMYSVVITPPPDVKMSLVYSKDAPLTTENMLKKERRKRNGRVRQHVLRKCEEQVKAKELTGFKIQNWHLKKLREKGSYKLCSLNKQNEESEIVEE